MSLGFSPDQEPHPVTSDSHTGDRALKHIGLRPPCGLCEGVLSEGVSFVPCKAILFHVYMRLYRVLTQFLVVMSPGTRLALNGCLDTATFPQRHEYRLVYHGRLLCWSPWCRPCLTSSDAVALHSDCFKLFRKECSIDDALDRLWTMATARSPWPDAPKHYLGSHKDISVDLIYEKAERHGMPQLKLLPPELIHMIRDCSQSGTFWRYITVQSISRELSTISSSSRASISAPLRDVMTWARGREMTLLRSSNNPPFMRLTVDSRGIRQIESLLCRPLYQQHRSDQAAFAMLDRSQLEDATIHVKVTK